MIRPLLGIDPSTGSALSGGTGGAVYLVHQKIMHNDKELVDVKGKSFVEGNFNLS